MHQDGNSENSLKELHFSLIARKDALVPRLTLVRSFPGLRSFPGSCLGMHGLGGSASRFVRSADERAGRACNSFASQAEPGNQMQAIIAILVGMLLPAVRNVREGQADISLHTGGRSVVVVRLETIGIVDLSIVSAPDSPQAAFPGNRDSH